MDVLNDNSHRTWHKIGKLILNGKIPDYVKQYTPLDKEAASTLSDEVFAEPGKRAFPIDSAPNIWLSAAYFAHNRDQLPTKVAAVVENRIKEAAKVWGLSNDVDKVIQAVDTFNGSVKCAADNDANYGWILPDGTKRYPLFDADGVVKAAAFFDENRRHYPFEVRKQIATKIMEKGAEYGLAVDDLPRSVAAEAGYGLPRKSVLMRELNERAILAKDAEAGALLANVNRLIGSGSDAEIGAVLDKVATVIDAFDRSEQLVKHYGKRITSPADFLAGVSYKEAAEFVKSAVKLRRHIFDAVKLAEAFSPQTFDAILGDDATKDLIKADGKLDSVKLAEFLRALPQEEKGAVEDHLVSLCG